jgi:hypothetical protein
MPDEPNRTPIPMRTATMAPTTLRMIFTGERRRTGGGAGG